MGKLDFPWTIILFVSFVGKFMSSALIVSAAKGNTPLEIYVSSSNLLISLLIASLCGFFFLLVCVCIVLGKFLGSHFFHSSFPVPFRSIENPTLVYLFWQVCVCSAKGDTPLDPRSSFSFFFSFLLLAFFYCF